MDRRTPQDGELLARAGGGDRAAFTRLMRRHYAGVVAYLERAAGAGPHRAEDLAQEVFLRAYLKAGSFRGGGSAAGWLYAIATHLVIDASRRRGPGPVAQLPEIGDRRDEPARRSIEGENRDALDAALQELRPEQRRLVWLKFAEGLSFAEMAEALGQPRSTLKYQLKQAARALAAGLGRRGLTGETIRSQETLSHDM